MQSNVFLKKQLEGFFKKEKEDTQDLLDRIRLLIFQSEAKETDLYVLHQLIDSDSLTKLINYYDGGYIKLPTKEEWKNCLIMIIVYYLRKIKNVDWKDIKNILNIPDKDFKINNSISMGLKIKNFSDKIYNEFRELINALKDKEVLKTFNKIMEKEQNNGKEPSDS